MSVSPPLELGLSPQDLGLPAKFQRWRPYQEDAILSAASSQKRFVAQAAPVGSGKSASYVAQAILQGYRVAVLTSTKGLQDQLRNDFSSLHMADIRGRGNYSCHMSPGMTCEDGAHAGCRSNGTARCPYTCAHKIARSAPFVVTNYPYYILQNKFGEGLGSFDLLVLDEAHNAPEEICSVMSVSITSREVYRMLRADFPPDGSSIGTWSAWGMELLPAARVECDRLSDLAKSRIGGMSLAEARELREWKNLVSKLGTLTEAKEEWEAEAIKGGYKIDPVWASEYADALFLKVPHVLMVSATVVPKTLDLLGLIKEDYDYQEYPSTFPPRRSPLIYIPTVRVTHKWQPWMMELWLDRIDQVVGRRLDRKGIVHTVSYDRRNTILERSKYSEYMMSHSTGDAIQQVEAFRASQPPSILVSPAMATGWDFPYCLAPETRVLTSDLRWIQVGSLDVGDSLLAFDESIVPPLPSRTWRESIVTSCERTLAPCYRLFLEDGTVITCSSKHKWLIPAWSGSNRTVHWKSTEELCDCIHPILRERGRFTKNSQAGPTSLARLLDVWDTAQDWDAGYLAGAFNGEGCLYQCRIEGYKQMHLTFVQQDNIMLADVQSALSRKGYDFRTHRRSQRARMKADCIILHIRQRANILRFLGQIRPSRLLPKLDCSILGSIRSRPLKLLEKENVGIREVVALATTTKTLIAEGLASHNSDCEYQIITKVPYPDCRSRIMRARVKADPEYQNYVTSQALVQSCGRGMRAADDSCENIVVDDMVRVIMATCGDLLPGWFRKLYRRSDILPEPPPRLERRNKA